MRGARMLPDRCSIRQGGRACPSPPEFVVSVAAAGGEYMVGVACGRHRAAVAGRVAAMQARGDVPGGKVGFEALRPVGTDCVRSDPDGLLMP